MGEVKGLLALFVLILTYLGLGMGPLPGYRMNRAGGSPFGITSALVCPLAS